MKRRKLNGEKIFSVIITFAIILTVAIGAISVIKTTKKSNENVIDLNETKEFVKNEAQTKGRKNPVNEEEGLSEYWPEEVVEETKSEQSRMEIMQEVIANTSANAVFSFGENDKLSWPVHGVVLMNFNMDSTVYFRTLGVYKVNPAMIIAADVGTECQAAASGVIEEIYYSEETGTTVVESIGDGYKIIYGQLEDVDVLTGASVVSGTKIGTVAEPTKYYTSEGSNLYFELTKDGEPVNPADYLD